MKKYAWLALILVNIGSGARSDRYRIFGPFVPTPQDKLSAEEQWVAEHPDAEHSDTENSGDLSPIVLPIP